MAIKTSSPSSPPYHPVAPVQSSTNDQISLPVRGQTPGSSHITAAPNGRVAELDPLPRPFPNSPAAQLDALPSDFAPFLVVDDNEINVKLLSAYLHKRNFHYTTADNGVSAVAAYKAARGVFSAVLMDIQMPRMDGIAATRMIREFERQEGLSAVVIVALTGLATHEKKTEAEANGVNEFLPKPVRLKELTRILEASKRLHNHSER